MHNGHTPLNNNHRKRNWLDCDRLCDDGLCGVAANLEAKWVARAEGQKAAHATLPIRMETPSSVERRQLLNGIFSLFTFLLLAAPCCIAELPCCFYKLRCLFQEGQSQPNFCNEFIWFKFAYIFFFNRNIEIIVLGFTPCLKLSGVR